MVRLFFDADTSLRRPMATTNAFAGSKEEIGDLKHARDVAIGLVRATLAGADPGEVGRLVEHIRTTGRAHGISMKALPEPEKEKER